jgi:hypothetical protein
VAQAGLRQGELGGASPCSLIDWAPSLLELPTASQAATAEPPDLYGVILVCGVAEVHAVIQQTLHQKPLPPKTFVQMNAFSRERARISTGQASALPLIRVMNFRRLTRPPSLRDDETTVADDLAQGPPAIAAPQWPVVA